jgi:hypothetical protein
MTDREKLEAAVKIVNILNRPGARPVVEVVECSICGVPFASQPQDVALARRRGLGRICPGEECQREARRMRQRGERTAAFGGIYYQVFRAALGMGFALAGKPNPHAFHPKSGATVDRPGAEDDLWKALLSLRDQGQLRGETSEEWLKYLSSLGGPPWRREALRKIVSAWAILEKRRPKMDPQAFELLGQAAWDCEDADHIWWREIVAVWPERPGNSQ